MAVSTSLRAERGFEQAFEKIASLHGALAGLGRDFNLAVEREQAGRQLGGRVGKGDRAAERAAVADGGVADVRHGQRDQRRVPGNVGGARRLGMARHARRSRPFRS